MVGRKLWKAGCLQCPCLVCVQLCARHHYGCCLCILLMSDMLAAPCGACAAAVSAQITCISSYWLRMMQCGLPHHKCVWSKIARVC